MMVKLNMLVCLSILGFTISLFKSCDCGLDVPRFRLCCEQLNKVGFNAKPYAQPPKTKNERINILKKMCDTSLCDAANAYILRLNIDCSKLYTMLREFEDNKSATHNEQYNNDLDVLQELIERHVHKLSENDLDSISDFNLDARTFCNEVNTLGGPYYVANFCTDEKLSSSSSNNNDYLNVEDESYTYLGNLRN